MDECCLLPSQLLVPSLDWLPASGGLVSRLQPKQPLRLRFGRAPTLPSNASTLQLDGITRWAAPHTHPPSPAAPEGLLHAKALPQVLSHTASSTFQGLECETKFQSIRPLHKNLAFQPLLCA